MISTKGTSTKRNTKFSAGAVLISIYFKFVSGTNLVDLGYTPISDSIEILAGWEKQGHQRVQINVLRESWHNMSYTPYLVEMIKFWFKRCCLFPVTSHLPPFSFLMCLLFQPLEFLALRTQEATRQLCSTAILSYGFVIYCFPPEGSLNTLHGSRAKFATVFCLFSIPSSVYVGRKCNLNSGSEKVTIVC